MRTRVYIAPMDDLGNLSKTDGAIDNWTEITKDVLLNSIRPIKKAVDRNEFQIGFVKVSAVSFKVSNLEGKYSEVSETTSLFKFARKGTPVKITFDMADDDDVQADYFEPDTMFLPVETEVFRGLIDDSSTKMDLKDHNLTFKILGFESLIGEVLAPALTAGTDTVSTAIYKCLNQSRITNFVTVDQANIAPENDPILDVVSHFDGKSAKETIEELLIAGNSILFVDYDLNIKVQGRTPTGDSRETFYGPANDNGNQSVSAITNVDSGTSQIINYVSIADSATFYSDVTSISKYGLQKIEIDIPCLTNAAKRLAVATAIVNYFRNPKRRFDVEVPISIARLEYPLMGVLKLDFPPMTVDSDLQGFYEVSEYEVAEYLHELTSFEVLENTDHAIIGIRQDLAPKKYSLVFTVKEV